MRLVQKFWADRAFRYFDEPALQPAKKAQAMDTAATYDGRAHDDVPILGDAQGPNPCGPEFLHLEFDSEQEKEEYRALVSYFHRLRSRIDFKVQELWGANTSHHRRLQNDTLLITELQLNITSLRSEIEQLEQDISQCQKEIGLLNLKVDDLIDGGRGRAPSGARKSDEEP